MRFSWRTTVATAAAATLAATSIAVTPALAESGLVTLNDRTFEHDTQATTGGTTGDWFVTFHSAPD